MNDQIKQELAQILYQYRQVGQGLEAFVDQIITLVNKPQSPMPDPQSWEYIGFDEMKVNDSILFRASRRDNYHFGHLQSISQNGFSKNPTIVLMLPHNFTSELHEINVNEASIYRLHGMRF